MIPPPQRVPIGGTLITPGIEGIHETEQAVLQPFQPISQESHIGTTSRTVQEHLLTAPNVCQQPLDRSNIPDVRRITDMGTNTSNVVIEPTGIGPRPSHMEAHVPTSKPIVDVQLPSGLGDHITIPHVNLSILGYEPDSLGTAGIRSPPVRAQEVSVIPQLDGPGSLPIRDHTTGRVDRFSDQVEPNLSQGGIYVWRASTIRRRKYHGGVSDSDDYRRPHRSGRPLTKEDILVEDPMIEMEGPLEEDILMKVGDPLVEEETLVEEPLIEEEDPLDVLEVKDHQALKDLLGP